jgi:ribosome biogenesis GTPase
MVRQVEERIKDVPVIPVSNQSQKGIHQLEELIEKGKTYCLLGSSGVGKSTILNSLMGREMMKTGEISEHSIRGKHVTSHRELLVLENGGILIDNPGMREVGIVDSSAGLDRTFEKIIELAGHCKFKDCSHTQEKGCAVIEALEQEEIDPASYENYLKMEREKEHFESSLAEKRQKDKAFGKMIRQFKNVKNRGNFS